MKTLKALADELEADFESYPEGVSVSFLPVNPNKPITNEDMERARKIWGKIQNSKRGEFDARG